MTAAAAALPMIHSLTQTFNISTELLTNIEWLCDSYYIIADGSALTTTETNNTIKQ